MEEELERITSALSDKSAAMSLIRSALYNTSNAGVDAESDEDDEDAVKSDHCNNIFSSSTATLDYFDWPINQNLSASKTRKKRWHFSNKLTSITTFLYV